MKDMDFAREDTKNALVKIRDRLVDAGRGVLLVLDDLWRDDDEGYSYLAALNFATHPARHNAGSRLIVTTRDCGTLAYAHRGEQDKSIITRQPPPLRPDVARGLLLRHAGAVIYANLTAPHQKLADDIVKECGMLPLALSVVGGGLDSDCSNWEAAIDTLREHGHNRDRVLDACRTSYDALPPSLQRCFVDLAAWPPATRVNEVTLLSLFAAHAPLASPARLAGCAAQTPRAREPQSLDARGEPQRARCAVAIAHARCAPRHRHGAGQIRRDGHGDWCRRARLWQFPYGNCVLMLQVLAVRTRLLIRFVDSVVRGKHGLPGPVQSCHDRVRNVQARRLRAHRLDTSASAAWSRTLTAWRHPND